MKSCEKISTTLKGFWIAWKTIMEKNALTQRRRCKTLHSRWIPYSRFDARACFHNRVAKKLDTLWSTSFLILEITSYRVPALNLLCECPSVKGALTSLLGEDYLLLPHRFPHNSEPLGMASDATPTKTGKRKDEKVAQKSIEAFASNPKMATGSISASAWHQDSHASCGRTRWHTPRAINIFYFPHDVPLEMGPTRFLAGSHLYATLHDLRSDQAFMQEMPAGAVVLAHFDLVHAGSPNYSDQMRYVMKFVALRTKNPSSRMEQ